MSHMRSVGTVLFFHDLPLSFLLLASVIFIGYHYCLFYIFEVLIPYLTYLVFDLFVDLLVGVIILLVTIFLVVLAHL